MPLCEDCPHPLVRLAASPVPGLRFFPFSHAPTGSPHPLPRPSPAGLLLLRKLTAWWEELIVSEEGPGLLYSRTLPGSPRSTAEVPPYPHSVEGHTMEENRRYSVDARLSQL